MPPPRHEERIKTDGQITLPSIGPSRPPERPAANWSRPFTTSTSRLLHPPAVTVRNEGRFFYVKGQVKNPNPVPLPEGNDVLGPSRLQATLLTSPRRQRCWYTRRRPQGDRQLLKASRIRGWICRFTRTTASKCPAATFNGPIEVADRAQAPVSYDIFRLPCVVGRKSSANLRLEAPGVWDEHVCLELDSERRINARVLGGALLTLNGQSVQQLPCAAVMCWNSAAPRSNSGGLARQRNFRTLELLTWVVLAVVSLTQVAVIYGLLR